MPRKKKIYFSTLKPAEKRMAIFADIIATLALPASKRFKPTNRKYFRLTGYARLKTGSLQALLPKVEKNCEACAMGACFLSHVRLANQFNIDKLELGDCEPGRFADDDIIMPQLRKYFSPEHLRNIEAAFEGQFFGCASYSEADYTATRNWYYLSLTPEQRLRAIAENGLRNKGTFKLHQVPTPAMVVELQKKPVTQRKKAA